MGVTASGWSRYDSENRKNTSLQSLMYKHPHKCQTHLAEKRIKTGRMRIFIFTRHLRCSQVRRSRSRAASDLTRLGCAEFELQKIRSIVSLQNTVNSFRASKAWGINICVVCRFKDQWHTLDVLSKIVTFHPTHGRFPYRHIRTNSPAS